MFGWNPKQPSPAQRAVGDVLFNDSVHVLSTFDLNRIASLTYGDDVCDEIFEMLEGIQRHPLDHSILTVQKSLVITKHVLIYGSEKCVNSSIALQRGVEELLEYNTVLWAQKQEGAASFIYRLKGGGVDKGYPVRETAKDVHPLLFDELRLRELRNSSADPNSLVPIGSDKVAFLSDDVRHYMLKKRIQEQYNLQTKSNLVQEGSGGFGSGYASKDGKQVVGAAHGLEEMIKQAEIANRKFRDDGRSSGYEIPDLSEFKVSAPAPAPATTLKANHNNADLLFGGANPQQGTTAVGDLLDFSAGVSQAQPATALEADLLGVGSPHVTGASDLLGGGATAAVSSDRIDIFLEQSTAPPPSNTGLLDFGSTTQTSGDLLGGVTDSLFNLEDISSKSNAAGSACFEPPKASLEQVGSAPKEPKKNAMISIMSSNEDRFAALDALALPETNTAGQSLLSAQEAENRLLGQATLNGSLGQQSAATLDPAPSLNPPLSAFGSLGPSPEQKVSLGGHSAQSGLGMDFASATLGINLTMPVHSTDPTLSENNRFATAGSGIKVAQTVSSLQLSSTWGDGIPGESDVDDAFVMGGTIGAGLEPSAAAPCAPPPPPPPGI